MAAPRLVPKSVLIAGAAGIGVFISFVGLKVIECTVNKPYVLVIAHFTAMRSILACDKQASTSDFGTEPGLGVTAVNVCYHCK